MTMVQCDICHHHAWKKLFRMPERLQELHARLPFKAHHASAEPCIVASVTSHDALHPASAIIPLSVGALPAYADTWPDAA
jgi:hypothetical protein